MTNAADDSLKNIDYFQQNKRVHYNNFGLVVIANKESEAKQQKFIIIGQHIAAIYGDSMLSDFTIKSYLVYNIVFLIDWTLDGSKILVTRDCVIGCDLNKTLSDKNIRWDSGWVKWVSH